MLIMIGAEKVELVYRQGADFKNNETTKQRNNFIWTNRKQVKFCF